MSDLSLVAGFLKEKDNFEILTHHYPDGDTLGSGYGLCHILRAMGKKARVITSGNVARKYGFLAEGIDKCDFERKCVISVDVAAASLLGDNQQEYEGIIDLCIDHHGTNSIEAGLKFVDATAAATCEIIYDLACELGAEITPLVANCIYTGVSTDTGCFRFSNTTPKTHMIAAKMMEQGAEWHTINTEMFEVKSKERLLLERMVYETLEYHCNGKCAIIHTTLEMQKKANIGDDEVEGLASIPRRIEGVYLGITVREKEGGVYKVSARSNEDFSAADFCAHFGGGGHAAAAGCTLEGDLASVKAELLKVAEEML
ncbi:MAG: bifunctional oligoribonuclease/PAP phosphatase NrnA [Ruminococcus sp.]